MQLFCETSDIGSRPSVATIGFFDGVHRGHRYLIEQVCAVAAGRGLASSVVTFPVHPRKVMQADYHPKLLTTCDEKVSLLAKTGVDYCMMLDFTPEIARLSAREFMSILKDRYQIQALVVGTTIVSGITAARVLKTMYTMVANWVWRCFLRARILIVRRHR